MFKKVHEFCILIGGPFLVWDVLEYRFFVPFFLIDDP